MTIDIKDRILSEAKYIAETGQTVRETARVMGISKSTVHKDMTQRLMHVDKKLFREVRDVLDQNKAQRHIRGGIATKNKYLRMKDDTLQS